MIYVKILFRNVSKRVDFNIADFFPEEIYQRRNHFRNMYAHFFTFFLNKVRSSCCFKAAANHPKEIYSFLSDGINETLLIADCLDSSFSWLWLNTV